MNTKVPAQVLTPEERRERWYARYPLPCYIRTKDKYGDAVYLVEKKEDFGTIALSILKQRSNNGCYGDDSWYFSGSFAEYVLEKTGVTMEEAEALIASPLAEKMDILKNFKTRFGQLKKEWLAEQEDIREQRTIKRILSGDEGTHPLNAIAVLQDRSGGEYEYFSIELFDKP